MIGETGCGTPLVVGAHGRTCVERTCTERCWHPRWHIAPPTRCMVAANTEF